MNLQELAQRRELFFCTGRFGNTAVTEMRVELEVERAWIQAGGLGNWRLSKRKLKPFFPSLTIRATATVGLNSGI